MKYQKLSLKTFIFLTFFQFQGSINPFVFSRTYRIEQEILKYLVGNKKYVAGAFLPSTLWFLLKNIPISFSLKNPIYSQKNSYEILKPVHETDISFFYIHGWTEKTYIKKLGNTIEHATVIIPHFVENIKNRRFKTAFGQESDVISILKSLKENRQEIINIVARSRGVQGFLNALYVLSCENHPLLKIVEIDAKMQKIILENMQKGVIILVVPLIDIPTTFKYHLGPILGTIMAKYIFPRVSGKRYKYNGMHALRLLQKKAHFIPHLNISIVFAERDWVTGVRKAEQQLLIKTLNDFNQKEVEVFYVAGGHKGIPQKEKMQELISKKIVKNTQDCKRSNETNL